MNKYDTLSIKKVQPSTINPRKTFSPDALAELTESVKTHGVLQPILVRPVNSHFEIVAGERRWRAVTAAGLQEIPAIVREMDDKAALEVAVIENLQRADLHPLEEAEGYSLLISKHKYSAETLAAKVNKSLSYVYQRMKLVELPKKAKEAMHAGKLSLKVALLVARIPVPELREKACQEVTAKHHGDHGMTPSHAAEYIREHYQLLLKDAPFTIVEDLHEPNGMPLPPCVNCHNRTANVRDLFEDVGKEDLCLDPKCHKAKSDAKWTKLCADAESDGMKVMSNADQAVAFPSWSDRCQSSQFVELTDKCWEDGKGRTYQQILGKKAAVSITLARDKHGGIHKLVNKAEVLKAAGVKMPQYRENDSWKKQEAKRREDGAVKRLAVQGAIAEILEAPKLGERLFWGYVLRGLLESSWADVIREVAQRRQLAGKDHLKAILEASESMDVDQLQNLLLELIAWKGAFSSWSNTYGENIQAACALFGVDLKAIERKVRAHRTAEKKSKAKASGPAANKAVEKKPVKKGRKA